MSPEEAKRADIIEIGRRLHQRAYVASNDGNISVRLDAERLLTTPKGVSKGFMSPDMLVVTDYEGRKLAGERDPSSELPMHLAVYRRRADVTAVVHAHPPVATGFAVAGIPLDRAVLAEVVTTLGSIPIAEYGTPSTQELADAVDRHIAVHDGLLLANHGAITVADGLLRAYYKMETIEHFARISVVAPHPGSRAAAVARGGQPPAGAAGNVRDRLSRPDLPGGRRWDRRGRRCGVPDARGAVRAGGAARRRRAGRSRGRAGAGGRRRGNSF